MGWKYWPITCLNLLGKSLKMSKSIFLPSFSKSRTKCYTSPYLLKQYHFPLGLWPWKGLLNTRLRIKKCLSHLTRHSTSVAPNYEIISLSNAETTHINATPRVEAFLKWILTIISCGTSWIKSLHDTHMIFRWRVSFNTSRNLQWENKYHGLIKRVRGRTIVAVVSTIKPIQGNCRSCDLGDSNTLDIVSYFKYSLIW